MSSRNFVGDKARTHGMSSTRIYAVWSSMIARCSNPKNSSYKYYGDRGITVCGEWKDFDTFKKWALSNGYKDKLTIDRKNNSNNYEPSNCQWVTVKEQANNRRGNHLILYNGKTKTIEQWSNETGILYPTLNHRINVAKWNISKALETKVKYKHARQEIEKIVKEMGKEVQDNGLL